MADQESQTTQARLDEALALVASAFEAAADVFGADKRDEWPASAILDLMPIDARAALDAMLAKARNDGRDRQCEKCDRNLDAVDGALEIQMNRYQALVNALDQHGRFMLVPPEEAVTRAKQMVATEHGLFASLHKHMGDDVPECNTVEEKVDALVVSARKEGRRAGVDEERARWECPAQLPLADLECPYAEGACGTHTTDLLRLLAKARERADAEIAAAYEAVAAVVTREVVGLMEDCQKPLDVALENFAEIVIPMLTPADARARLDDLVAEAREEGRKQAALDATDFVQERCDQVRAEALEDAAKRCDAVATTSGLAVLCAGEIRAMIGGAGSTSVTLRKRAQDSTPQAAEGSHSRSGLVNRAPADPVARPTGPEEAARSQPAAAETDCIPDCPLCLCSCGHRRRAHTRPGGFKGQMRCGGYRDQKTGAVANADDDATPIVRCRCDYFEPLERDGEPLR